MPAKQKQLFLPAAAAAGLSYGLFLRLLMFRTSTPHIVPSLWLDMLFPTAIWVMTAGFLFVGPFAVGWITAATGTESGENRWASWIFLPWFAILLADLCLFVVGLEGWICIVFAIPITLVMSSLGGIAGGLIAVSRFRQKGVATLCIAVLPLLLAGLEQHFDGITEIRTVETTILIHAPAPVIWANVASVPLIRHDELAPHLDPRHRLPAPHRRDARPRGCWRGPPRQLRAWIGLP